MVQFGQTLNEKVKGEWRSHAVPYNELKQILRTTQNGEANSVHTELSYSISTAQKAAFGRMYERAVVKLVAFYEDKSQWARSKSIELEQEVTLCLRAPEGVDISGLIDRLSNFSKEVGLVLEFLELNVMACSKITKKVCTALVYQYEFFYLSCAYSRLPSLTNGQDQLYEHPRCKGSRLITIFYLMGEL